MNKVNLILSDGNIFTGQTKHPLEGVFFGDPVPRGVLGEVVFNTGMTGYTESLTDPSYSGQILVFTYPLIGNYGVEDKNKWESDKIHPVAVVTSTASDSFAKLLAQNNVPLLTDVDTRALTKYLRSRGTMVGAVTDNNAPQPPLTNKRGSKGEFVTIPKPKIYNAQYKKTIILVDCGAKENIVRELCKLPFQIKRVPMDYDYSGENFAGIFLSNGPGDPADYKDTIRILRKVIGQTKNPRPIMGICLGSQIMGLAAGAKTYKLKFGHRGHNQPVQAVNHSSSIVDHCFITSQNHGYAVDEKTLPKDWQVSFRNLNDNSVEGIEHKNKPFFSVQFHPEAAPGPTDTRFLFKKFHDLL